MAVVVKPVSGLVFSRAQLFELCCTICDWERLEYGRGKHRVPEVLISCIDTSNTGFFCAFEGDKLVGYADLWQLKSSFYSVLLSGCMHEEQIMDYQIVGRQDVPSACWYVGSVITCPTIRSTFEVRSKTIFKHLFQALYSVLLATPYPAKVMGVGSSEFGKKFLSHHGFKAVIPSAEARDLRPRYEKLLEPLGFELEAEPAGKVSDVAEQNDSRMWALSRNF